MEAIKCILVNFLLMLISIIHAYGQNSIRSDEFVKIAEKFKSIQQRDSAIYYYNKAAMEYQSMGNVEQFVDCYNQIGVILTRQDDYERSKSYLDAALSVGLASLDSNNLFIAATYLGLGVNYNAEENYKMSLLYHYKALKIRLSKLGEINPDVATSYGNIGNVYFNSKEYDNAVDAHLKAMVIREQLFGDSGVEVIQSYSNLGKTYRELKDFKLALYYYEKALNNKIIQVGLEHKDLAKYFENVSDVYYLLGNQEQGDIYKLKSEKLIKS